MTHTYPSAYAHDAYLFADGMFRGGSGTYYETADEAPKPRSTWKDRNCDRHLRNSHRRYNKIHAPDYRSPYLIP